MLSLPKKKLETTKQKVDNDELFSALKQIRTLKVSANGAISVDPNEIIKHESFIRARNWAHKAIVG